VRSHAQLPQDAPQAVVAAVNVQPQGRRKEARHVVVVHNIVVVLVLVAADDSVLQHIDRFKRNVFGWELSVDVFGC